MGKAVLDNFICKNCHKIFKVEIFRDNDSYKDCFDEKYCPECYSSDGKMNNYCNNCGNSFSFHRKQCPDPECNAVYHFDYIYDKDKNCLNCECCERYDLNNKDEKNKCKKHNFRINKIYGKIKTGDLLGAGKDKDKEAHIETPNCHDFIKIRNGVVV